MDKGITSYIPYLRFEEGGEVPSAKHPLSDDYVFELTGPSPEAVDQARRLALIEMQMDPGAREVFDNNPYARLGLDILERGEFPDKETADFGAKLTAAVIGEGDAIPSNLRGRAIPSYALGSDALGEDVRFGELGERVRQVLSDQGVTDPEMSRKEGSTAYYLAGGLPDEKFFTGGRARTLQVIAHELGHLGYMALQRKMREETGKTTYYQDEDTLDLKDYESSKRLGIIPGSDDVRAYKLITDDRELVPGVTVGEYNRGLFREQERDAYELMRQRGMPLIEQGPPEPPPPEPEKGIGAKFLELIGVQ